MSDIAGLRVRVTSEGIENTGKQLDALGRFATAAEKQIELLGRIATAVERQIELLGGSSALASSQASALGAASAASASGITAMGASSAAAAASVNAVGAASMASAAAVAGAGKAMVAYSGGTNLLTSANTSLVTSIGRSGLSMIGYGDDILRIGHTSKLSAGAMDAFGQAANGPSRSLMALAKANEVASTAAVGFAKNYGGMIATVGSGAIVLAAIKLTDYTDRMAKMQGQLKLVTGSQEELNAVYGRALTLANETGQSLEATVNLYARMARATEDLNLSQNDLFTITKAINQSFVVSGATAAEASSAMLQLSQGMASGVLRGEELNAVMESSPRLARLLADGLGVGIGELRRMGAEGELTSEKVTNAIKLMAGSVDSEFQQMPMTIGRATQEIKNNLLDAFGAADSGPAVKAIKAMNSALADPAMKKNLKDLGSMSIEAGIGVASLTASLINLAATTFTAIGDGIAFLIDKARGLGAFKDDLDRLGETATGENISKTTSRIAELKDEIVRFSAGGERFAGAVIAAEAELKGLESQLKSATASTGTTTGATANYKARLDAAGKSINNTTEGLIKLASGTNKQTEGSAKAQKAVQGMITALDFETKQLKVNALQQAINTAVQKAGTTATAAEIEQIKSKTAALFIQTTTLEAEADAQEDARARSAASQAQAAGDAAKAAEDMATAATKASEDAMKPWNDALTDMASSIDTGFTQAWRDAFSGTEDGFKNFAGNLKDSFLNLLANMAHLAITRPIAMQFSAALGGLVPGAASGGVSGATAGASSLTSGLSSLTSGITAAGKGLYSSLGTITNDLGLFKTSNAFNAKAAATTGWSMAGDFAGGMIGGYAGSKVFGETSGVGASIGAIAGSALIGVPVLGAAIGSFVGTAIESGLGKAFGYGGNNNDGKNVARADFDFSTGTFGKGAGSGNSWKKGEGREQADFVDQLMGQLSVFGDAIGGSTLKGGITADSGGKLSFNGKAFSDANQLLAYGFGQIVAASDKVSDRLKPLIANFSGSAEEIAVFTTGLVALDVSAGGISDTLLTLIQNASGTAAEIVQFSQAIVSISQQAGINSVTNAIKEFSAVAPTVATAYRDHSAALLEQIRNFDGSAASASNLNNLLIENKTAAYQFAMAIQTIGQQIGIVAADQAEYIRQSVLTADQLRTARVAERDSLSAMLASMTDPQEIDKASKSILDLNRKIFDSLAENEKLRRSEEFASYAEQTNVVAQGLLQGALTGLQSSQEDINIRIIDMLDSAADKQQQAANTNLAASGANQDASQTFSEAVNNLVTNGITINDNRLSEAGGV